MLIHRLDHLVLTVASIDASVRFYGKLGLQHVEQDGRHSLIVGSSAIKLHEHGRSLTPAAARPTPGSADICLVVDASVEDVKNALAGAGVQIETGPVQRHGALGVMSSIYVRDPDQNLIELAHYLDERIN